MSNWLILNQIFTENIYLFQEYSRDNKRAILHAIICFEQIKSNQCKLRNFEMAFISLEFHSLV